MDRRGCWRIELTESLVCGGRIAVVLALDVRARRGLDGRRDLEIDERRTEYSPAPPAMTAAPFALTSSSIASWASSANSPTDMDSERSRTAIRRVGSAGWFVRIGSPRYTWSASAETTSVRRRLASACHGRFAGCRRAKDRDDLDAQSGAFLGHPGPPPTASIAVKIARVDHEMCRECAFCARSDRNERRLAPAQRRRCRVLDNDVDEPARRRGAREVDRRVAPRAPTLQLGIGSADTLDEDFLDPTDASRVLSAAVRWTTPTSRSSRSCFTSSGT